MGNQCNINLSKFTPFIQEALEITKREKKEVAIRICNADGKDYVDGIIIGSGNAVNIARQCKRADASPVGLLHTHPGNTVELSEVDRRELRNKKWDYLCTITEQKDRCTVSCECNNKRKG